MCEAFLVYETRHLLAPQLVRPPYVACDGKSIVIVAFKDDNAIVITGRRSPSPLLPDMHSTGADSTRPHPHPHGTSSVPRVNPPGIQQREHREPIKVLEQLSDADRAVVDQYPASWTPHRHHQQGAAYHYIAYPYPNDPVPYAIVVIVILSLFVLVVVSPPPVLLLLLLLPFPDPPPTRPPPTIATAPPPALTPIDYDVDGGII
jgi:hypothetical protein